MFQAAWNAVLQLFQNSCRIAANHDIITERFRYHQPRSHHNHIIAADDRRNVQNHTVKIGVKILAYVNIVAVIHAQIFFHVKIFTCTTE